MRQEIGFVDLHQDMLTGVERRADGFPHYLASHLTGACRATALLSSLFPDDPGTSLLAQLKAHEEMVACYSSSLRLITTRDDLDAEDARTGLLPHSEGLELPGIGPDALEAMWADRSLRSLSLTWNYETAYGFSCYDDAAAPLKPAGRQLLRALEDSPLFLDLAHLNDAGFYDALELYAPPILVTHSSCRAIVDHPRGLTDEQLRALGEHGGLVGLAFYPDFLGELGSIDEALRHIDRIVSLAGENAVAVGSDWGSTEMGELGDTASLVGLFDAVGTTFGPELSEKFAFGNADAFLRAALP